GAPPRERAGASRWRVTRKRRAASAVMLVNELARHGVDRDAPDDRTPHEQRSDAREILPAVGAEDGVANEHHTVMQRVDVREYLRPLGKVVEREERAGEQEERRQHGADDVVEVIDRLRVAGDGDPEARPAEPGN